MTDHAASPIVALIPAQPDATAHWNNPEDHNPILAWGLTASGQVVGLWAADNSSPHLARVDNPEDLPNFALYT